MDITMTNENAQRLVQLLWEKIETTGFNALSKNDFYDYVLYLYNRFNNEHFLDTLSNYENSTQLRATEQKIKSSKQNIFLKYADKAEKQRCLLVFFQKIANGKIVLRDVGKKDETKEYHFVVEDLNVRRRLESLLKDHCGSTMDYHLNAELVSLPARDFYILFSVAMNELRGFEGVNTELLKQQINTIKQDKENREIFEAIKDGAITLVETFTPLPAQKIVDIVKNVITVFSEQ